MHRIRLSLVAFLAATLAVGLAGSASADAKPSPDASTVDRVSLALAVDGKYANPVSFARAGIGIQQNPPGGGCDYWSQVRGTTTGYYVNHVLTTTESNYFTGILCTTTAPGQSMEGLHSESALWRNSAVVDRGTGTPCSDCNLASSTGSHPCAGQANCAGTYWVGHVANMQLPAGWVWVTPVPWNCILYTPTLIACSASSTTGVIPPTT